VALGHVLDLSDPSAVGLTRTEVTGPDQQRCQELAAAAMTREFDGLLVPSAALPGLNLVVLPRNLPEPPPIRVVSSTELPLDMIVRERPEEASEEGRG
jgi:RES domain-containing protein